MNHGPKSIIKMNQIDEAQLKLSKIEKPDHRQMDQNQWAECAKIIQNQQNEVK